MTSCIFVVDTDSYAGGVERELTAYVTGVVGECEVGEEFAELMRQEVDEEIAEQLEDLMDMVADDHGCLRHGRRLQCVSHLESL
jgi:hypothetical protein